MGSRLRAAVAGEGDSMRRREENSVRVTNLSEDTREDDLRVSRGCIIIARRFRAYTPVGACLTSCFEGGTSCCSEHAVSC